MPEKYNVMTTALVFFLVLSFTLTGCSKQNEQSKQDIIVTPISTKITPIDSPEIPARGFFMGILPVPANEQSFEEAYRQASKYAEFSPVWGRPTPFYDLSSELSGNWGNTFVEDYIRGNGMFPIICINFMGRGLTLEKPPNMSNASLNDEKWREAYKKAVLDVVKASRPLYLCIGNEVNRWYEKYGTDENPNGFQHYVSLYEEIYDSVKEISPETKVFCTFAREIVSENREANLEVLKMFNPDKIDILVFTSYPYSVKGINKPEDIPDNYYSKAFDYMPKKPFGFTEVGWPSIEQFGGEKEQANFLNQLIYLTKEQGIELEILGWVWLHDLDENDALGLIKKDGTEKLSYKVWRNLSMLNKTLN